MDARYETVTACRSCGDDLVPFLDLGETPLADRLLSSSNEEEPRVPLQVALCERCTLVQITENVSPEILFCRDYPYYSSVSPALMDHFRASAESLIERRELGRQSLVVEAASNDGYMLRVFAERDIPVLGIDPADGPAQAARDAGIPTLGTFFGRELAEQLAAEGRRADVFLANNVLAHVPDLNGFVRGIATVLADDGIAVIEVPYVLDLIQHREFDTIYHQHLCYFSVMALVQLFQRHGLHLNDVVRTRIHGGSLRLFVEKRANARPSVRSLIVKEASVGAHELGYYRDFGSAVGALRDSLLATLEGLRRGGKRVAGYGAAAKACTLMSYCGIGERHLDYLVDLNPHKHGRYMSGNRLPILPPSRLQEDRPDYLLVLAWNHAPEIMTQQREYARNGGRFIVPVPRVQVLP